MSYRTIAVNGIKISQGNAKLGGVPNFSTLPVRDCPSVCKRFCARKCYAVKTIKMYRTARDAWRGNGDAVRRDVARACDAVRVYCQKNRPRLFRWHVSGDLVSAEHFAQIVRVARACTETRFLIFTKAYEFVSASFPDNLSVVLSIWHGMPRGIVPRRLSRLPRAFAGPCPNHPRFKRALDCPGNCETCGLCWHLKTIAKDVRFDLH